MSKCLKYHLILESLNLYPSLADEAVPMIEQFINGVILISPQNLQELINRVITIESTCKSILKKSYKLTLRT